MTARRPLILDGSNNLIEMTDADLLEVQDRVRWLFAENPTVILSWQASGGSLGSISDTRKQAGVSTTDVTNYDTEAETGDISTVTVDFSTITEGRSNTNLPTDTNDVRFPIYQSGGNIYAMNRGDMIDTFIQPALDTMTGSVGQPGMYRIHSSTTLSGYTAVSSNPVFRDTRASPGEYNASEIGNTDQPQDHNPALIIAYYLLRKDNIAEPTMEKMLYIRNSDANIEEYTQAEMDDWLEPAIQSHAVSHMYYNLNGNGTNLGSGMTDTILNGSGNYQTRFVNSNDYRTQEFPNGSAVVAQTHRLKVEQV